MFFHSLGDKIVCSKKVLQFQVAAFMLSKGRLFVIILFKDAFTTKNYLSRKQPSMLKLGIHLNSNPPTPVCTSDTIFKADLRNDPSRGHKIFLLMKVLWHAQEANTWNFHFRIGCTLNMHHGHFYRNCQNLHTFLFFYCRYKIQVQVLL